MMAADLKDVARRILPLIDLTSLNDAKDDDVAGLCAKAVTPQGVVAAVCVWPAFVAEARSRLDGTGVAIATVINFPEGACDAAASVAETRQALDAGADEIDLVLPFETWLAGDRAAASAVISEVRQAMGEIGLLKVILETGMLGEAETIAAAGRDAIEAGADFLKTSTGKRQPGATLEAAEALLGVIEAGHQTIGFKASGGIRTVGQAAEYLGLADHLLGPGWANPGTFRIGASSLLDDVLAKLAD